MEEQEGGGSGPRDPKGNRAAGHGACNSKVVLRRIRYSWVDETGSHTDTISTLEYVTEATAH